jgi:hypothetical protein
MCVSVCKGVYFTLPASLVGSAMALLPVDGALVQSDTLLSSLSSILICHNVPKRVCVET